MTDPALRVAIVGAGFSAHAAAIAILRNTARRVRIALIDPREECGGLAYGRAEGGHVLNTRAAQFSVLPDKPGDFVSWAREYLPAIEGHEDLEDAYLPRSYVQNYIRVRLKQARDSAPGCDYIRVRDRVTHVSAEGGGYKVRLKRGLTIDCDVVILATGYGADRRLHFGLDPFGDISRRRAAKAKRIAFIGSGLTFLDGYLRVRALGFEGKAVSFSRSARLPAPHAPHHALPIRLGLAPGTPLRTLLRAARDRAAALGPGEDWRSLVNGLRVEAQPLWLGLTPEDKARFERHLRPIWDRMRHRAPPHLHAAVQKDIASGKLRLERARITASRHNLGGWSLDIEQAGERERAGGFDLVFDCSGPSTRSVHPLSAPLFDAGLARRGPGGAGIDVAPSGVMIRADGGASAGLYALGPLGAGSLFEITAAPEIIAQADLMAREVELIMPATGRSALPSKETLHDHFSDRRAARRRFRPAALRPAGSGSGG